MQKEIFEKLSSLQLLALVIYGEARGEGLDGMLAVASVVMNRVMADGWFGKNIKEVILKKKQFSCFNENDPNRPLLEVLAENFDHALRYNKVMRMCYWIAKGVLEGFLSSNVEDATHYHHYKVKPYWAKQMKEVRRIGNHVFYRKDN